MDDFGNRSGQIRRRLATVDPRKGGGGVRRGRDAAAAPLGDETVERAKKRSRTGSVAGVGEGDSEAGEIELAGQPETTVALPTRRRQGKRLRLPAVPEISARGCKELLDPIVGHGLANDRATKTLMLEFLRFGSFLGMPNMPEEGLHQILRSATWDHGLGTHRALDKLMHAMALRTANAKMTFRSLCRARLGLRTSAHTCRLWAALPHLMQMDAFPEVTLTAADRARTRGVFAGHPTGLSIICTAEQVELWRVDALDLAILISGMTTEQLVLCNVWEQAISCLVAPEQPGRTDIWTNSEEPTSSLQTDIWTNDIGTTDTWPVGTFDRLLARANVDGTGLDITTVNLANHIRRLSRAYSLPHLAKIYQCLAKQRIYRNGARSALSLLCCVVPPELAALVSAYVLAKLANETILSITP
jgi:hypothetical protein